MTQSTFAWERQERADTLLRDYLSESCSQSSALYQLQNDLAKLTSTRLLDWVDHISFGQNPKRVKDLTDCGFELLESTDTYHCYHHPAAVLPMLVLTPGAPDKVTSVAVCVESIADYLQSHGVTGTIEGSPLSGFRRCLVSEENGIALYVVERRATRSMTPSFEDSRYLIRYIQATELWLTRPRGLEDEHESMRLTLACAEHMVSLVGKDLAAWIVLEGERRYWQSRNTAGHVQRGRQDLLGMGWANHDHHTFRSSRNFFKDLVELFEILGFHCRERFYAGEEAGWGAQVMENTLCNCVLFLDVDLAPKELEIDFAHDPLPDLGRVGTIGLWCALHGDSILKSGMHHLEGQFDFDGLKRDLHERGVGMMQPFSDFTYLKQAFTEGEIWKVSPKRVEALRSSGLIADSEADRFLKYGAVGSHLENLERNDGFKGFNQKNVSYIIKQTDPRSLAHKDK